MMPSLLEVSDSPIITVVAMLVWWYNLYVYKSAQWRNIAMVTDFRSFSAGQMAAMQALNAQPTAIQKQVLKRMQQSHQSLTVQKLGQYVARRKRSKTI